MPQENVADVEEGSLPLGLLNLAMLDVGGMLNQRPPLICLLETAANSSDRTSHLERWRFHSNESRLANRWSGNDLPFRWPSILGRKSKGNRRSLGRRAIQGLNDLDIN